MSRRRHSIIGGNACDTAAKRSKVAGGGGGRRGVACLIIDPQNDFHSGGSLAVPGADAARGEDTSVAAVAKDVCCMVLAAILCRIVRVVLS